MNNKNRTYRYRQSRINSGHGTNCQDKSEDRIGNLLDLVVDGLLDPEATKEKREEGGAALIELVGLRAARRIGHPIQQEGDDIRGDARAGVLDALEKMRGKCFAFGPSFPTRKSLKGYVLGIIDRQIKSAIRAAHKRVSRKQAIAWQPLETEGARGDEKVHPLDKKALSGFQAKLKQHAPTPQQIQTAIEQAALRGELIGVEIYKLCREVCERQQQPCPKMPQASKPISDRTRVRRTAEGKERLKKLLMAEPEM